MWVCRKHKKLNEGTMKKQQARLKQNGGSLNFNVDCVNPAQSVNPPSKNLPHYVPTTCAEQVSTTTVPVQPIQSNSRKSRNAKKKKIIPSSGFIPVPRGTPVFMFEGVQGKTRSVNWFYDTGCSHLCMRNEIPVTEFESSLLQKGPFNIGGVGGMQVKANNEFTVKRKKRKLKRQQTQEQELRESYKEKFMLSMCLGVKT